MFFDLRLKNKLGKRKLEKDKRLGFTLVEFIVVVAVTLIITASVAPVYGNLQTTSQLNETVSQAAQFLRIGRQQSVDGFNNTAHGVKFQPDRYILYQGMSYAARNIAYDREVVLDDVLSITTDLTNDEVNFSKGSGEPNNSGTITINHEIEGFKSITVNAYGAVAEN